MQIYNFKEEIMDNENDVSTDGSGQEVLLKRWKTGTPSRREFSLDPSHVGVYKISCDESMIACGFFDSTVGIYEISTGNQVVQLDCGESVSSPATNWVSPEVFAEFVVTGTQVGVNCVFRRSDWKIMYKEQSKGSATAKITGDLILLAGGTNIVRVLRIVEDRVGRPEYSIFYANIINTTYV